MFFKTFAEKELQRKGRDYNRDLKHCRNATIEECAQIADNVGPDPMAIWIAATIRALKQ